MVLLAVLTMLAAGNGVASLARQAAELGPRVGDIIAFDPTRQAGFDSPAQLTAQRSEQTDCILDLRLLQRTGGSLVLEGRTAPPSGLYTAHWSGGHTSNEQLDCGIDASISRCHGSMSPPSWPPRAIRNPNRAGTTRPR